MHVSVSYGDMPIRNSISQIRFGCDIFVGTCGRIVHFIRDEIVRKYFLKSNTFNLLKKILV